MRKQQTIGRVTHCRGKGLHTGQMATLRFYPAPVDTGIVFLCRSGRESTAIRANVHAVVSTDFSTTLGQDGITVQTVEHLLAALAGLGIDNLHIEVQGPEIPILDGSAWPYVRLLQEAKICPQGVSKPCLKPSEPIQVVLDGRWIRIIPQDTLSITYQMNFDHPALEDQTYTYEGAELDFTHQISRARTYGFLKDVDRLRDAGFIQGGSLENAVVIGSHGVLNAEGLRYPDEPIRHKILDLIGDLSLLGSTLLGAVTVHQGGHRLHTQFVQAILHHQEAWALTGAAKNSALTRAPLTA